MNIKEIMTDRIATVEMDDSLKVIKDIFANAPFHHLLVLDADSLVGVVSDRDLLEAVSPYLGTAAEINRDTQSLTQPVHKIMSRNPIKLTHEASVGDAVSVFKAHKISCIPIVGESGELVGIVTWRDLLKIL